MTERGFVTIATGKTHYYRIAKNLLDSYRVNASGAFPFAIICDRENEYTAAFDKVVMLDNPTHSYMDKLRLFDCLPWEETIFIDADCLVYGDIDRWWKLFEENGSPAPFSAAPMRTWTRTEAGSAQPVWVSFGIRFTLFPASAVASTI